MVPKLNQQEPYGNAKLAGEEALADQKRFPWVVFRFSDVIGPRDVTRQCIKSNGNKHQITFKYF